MVKSFPSATEAGANILKVWLVATSGFKPKLVGCIAQSDLSLQQSENHKL